MNTSIALNSSISLSACTGLNIIGDQNVQGIFGGGTPIISNEGDPEIIIIVKFKEKVSLTHILIESGMDTKKSPAKVKLFAGIEDLDFSDADSVPATESFNLNGNLGKQISVRIPKYRNLSEISVKNKFFLLFSYFSKMRMQTKSKSIIFSSLEQKRQIMLILLK